MRTKSILYTVLAALASLCLIVSGCTKPNSSIGDDEDPFTPTSGTETPGDNGNGGNNGNGGDNGSSGTTTPDDGSSEGETNPEGEVTTPSSGDLISSFTAASTIKISWTSSGASVTGTVEGVTVANESGKVVVTSTTDSKICYELSGSGSGSFKLTSAKASEILLNGLTLTSSNGPVINIQSGKRVFIFTKASTTSTLTDSSNYTETEEDQKGSIFSEGQLTFCGSGTLKVTGKYKHAICSDDYIIAESGNVTITGAVTDGVHTNDYFILQNGVWDITSAGEGIDVEEGNICINGGEITANTTGDKAHAFKSSGNFRGNGGKVTSKVIGKASKCIKTDSQAIISKGEYNLTTTGGVLIENNEATSSACIKSNGNAEILGGTLALASSGQAGKGMNVDGTLTLGAEGSDGPTLTVSTTGSAYGSSGSGGWGGWGGNWGGGSSGTDSSKPKAIKSDGALTVNSGNITITTSQSEAEGMESKKSIVFNGGHTYIKAYDDAINCSYNITVNGGYVYAYSTGNDSIDSNANTNGAVKVNGGVLIAVTSKGSPEMGIDIDGKGVEVNGGYIFTMGGDQGTSSSSYSSSSTQASAFIKGISLSSGKYVHLYGDDKLLFSFKIPFTNSSSCSLISAEGYVKGTKCDIKTSSSEPSGYSDGWKDKGIYIGGSASSTTSLKSFTFSSIFYTSGSSGGR